MLTVLTLRKSCAAISDDVSPVGGTPRSLVLHRVVYRSNWYGRRAILYWLSTIEALTNVVPRIIPATFGLAAPSEISDVRYRLDLASVLPMSTPL